MTIHIPVFLRPHPLFSQTSTTSRAIPHKRPALTALYKPVQETAHSRARECAVTGSRVRTRRVESAQS